MQRIFRRFYVYSQEMPPVARAFAWFCLVESCLLLLNLSVTAVPALGGGATTVIRAHWEYVSLTSCSRRNSVLAGQADGADMPLIPHSIYHLEPGAWCKRQESSHHSVGGDFWMALIIVLWALNDPFLLAFTPLPPKPTNWKNDPKFLARCGAIIPAHRSASEIGQTVRGILRHISPENIIVVDNAASPRPLDNTEQVVRDVHPDVKYTFVPLGHKTLALWTGMQLLPDTVEFVIHVDDDTLLPRDFVLDESLFDDPDISEVSFICDTHECNWLTEAIGFTFKINSHIGYFNNFTSGTCLWAAGVIGIVRRRVLHSILSDHVFLPFGEDAFLGHLQLLNSYKIIKEGRCVVKTFAPPVMFAYCSADAREQGYGASTLFKQRARRWSVTKLRRSIWTMTTLFTWNGKSLWRNVWFRILNIIHFGGVTVAVYWIPLFFARLAYDLGTGSRQKIWYMFGSLITALAANYALQMLSLLAINYVLWRHRPDMQVSFRTVLATPFIKKFLVLCDALGHLSCVIYWVPFVPTRVWELARRPHEDAEAPHEKWAVLGGISKPPSLSAPRRSSSQRSGSLMLLTVPLLIIVAGYFSATPLHNPVFAADPDRRTPSRIAWAVGFRGYDADESKGALSFMKNPLLRASASVDAAAAAASAATHVASPTKLPSPATAERHRAEHAWRPTPARHETPAWGTARRNATSLKLAARVGGVAGDGSTDADAATRNVHARVGARPGTASKPSTEPTGNGTAQAAAKKKHRDKHKRKKRAPSHNGGSNSTEKKAAATEISNHVFQQSVVNNNIVNVLHQTVMAFVPDAPSQSRHHA